MSGVRIAADTVVGHHIAVGVCSARHVSSPVPPSAMSSPTSPGEEIVAVSAELAGGHGSARNPSAARLQWSAMHPLRRTAVTAVLAITASLLIASCSGSGGPGDAADGPSESAGSSSSAPPPDPPPPPPAVDDCRNLSYGDISRYSNDTPTIRCSKEHTAYTYGVEELPPAVAFDGVEIQNDAVQAAAARKCKSTFPSFIGGDGETRALARLTVTYFLPRQAGFDAGAHWVRCDVVAAEGPNSLAPLPKNLEGFLDKDNALDQYGVCSKGDPGAAGAVLVMCSQPHTYRAVEAIELGRRGAPYPGQAKTLKDGKEQCQEFVADLLGVSGGFTYAWTYPSSTDWEAGQRYGYCWNESDE
jgi:hypothetical protein